MYTEAPTCTRCCFCLPLRYGLIVWGYLKLFVGCLVLLSLSMTVVKTVETYETVEHPYVLTAGDIIMISIFAIIALVDIILTIAYIVGCHKKNVKLLRIYNFYSKILVTLAIAFSLYVLSTSIYYTYKYASYVELKIVQYTIMDATMLFANIGLQLYMILLIKSEIIKLDNRSQCRFVNNMAEAKCTVDINNTIEQLEREIEKKKIGEDSDDDMRIYA